PPGARNSRGGLEFGRESAGKSGHPLPNQAAIKIEGPSAAPAAPTASLAIEPAAVREWPGPRGRGATTPSNEFMNMQANNPPLLPPAFGGAALPRYGASQGVAPRARWSRGSGAAGSDGGAIAPAPLRKRTADGGHQPGRR